MTVAGEAESSHLEKLLAIGWGGGEAIGSSLPSLLVRIMIDPQKGWDGRDGDVLSHTATAVKEKGSVQLRDRVYKHSSDDLIDALECAASLATDKECIRRTEC